jgi:tricorn protease
MIRVTSSGYLRNPHLHGDLVAFVAEDDIWLAPVDGPTRAWRLTSDAAKVSNPRFSHDGTQLAWTSWRDGNPEVYVTDTQGSAASRLTYWGDDRTAVRGWTADGEVLAITANAEPDTYFTWAYAIPLDGVPRKLPYGPVSELALGGGSTALLTGRFSEPAYWKRYRGGTAGKLWTATAKDPLFTRILADLPSSFGGVMLVGDRLVFGSDHEGTGNIYSCALDGTDLRRHTDHDGFYARHPSTDGQRVVYQAAGDIWILDSLDAPQPRKLDIALGSPPQGRAPRMITAADHLGSLDCDQSGQASVVEVRGTIHWLTHKDGPARALHVDPDVRGRLPQVLGDDGAVVFATDDRLQITGGEPQSVLIDGFVVSLAASPDGAAVAAATQAGKLYVLDVASGGVTELAASDDGPPDGLAWSPDSAWLAWSQPGPQPLSRIRVARVADHAVFDVTDGRFADGDPVFTHDGLYLAFLSRRSFDPVYDAQLFDMSFPYGARPYIVPLGALTPSPFGPLPGGRPLTPPEDPETSERAVVTLDEAGLAGRVVTVPVPEARYSALRAVKGGLVWLREPVRGVLGESGAELDGAHPRPALERFDFVKRECSELVEELDWFEVSGDGTHLVVSDKDALRVLPAESKPDSPADAVTVDLTRARFLADPVALWRYAFDEAGRAMRRGYWLADMAGVDWDGVLDAYRPLLDLVRGVNDFTDLMWEVMGEVGSSHAYVRAPSADDDQADAVGQLGADISRDGSGRWTVDRVLPGESSDPRARSPLAAPGVAVQPGDVVLAVDGQDVDPVRGPWPLLAGTAGKPVSLTVQRAGAEEGRDVVVVPLSSQRRLRYQDWVASRRSLVRSLSDGRLGYLHIPDMMGEGWAHFSRDLRAEMRYEGLIMDVRGNGGGHISELVISKLAPQVIAWDVVRGQQAVSYPQDSRRGPMVTLADEMAGSDGDIVTAAIRTLGLGPVVGTRTWGGVIGYNEEFELIDGTRITTPELSFAFNEYGWGVENYGVDPDVEVLISPDDWAADRDPQLEVGVRLALEALAKNPAATPPDPATAPSRARPPLPPRSRP